MRTADCLPEEGKLEEEKKPNETRQRYDWIGEERPPPEVGIPSTFSRVTLGPGLREFVLSGVGNEKRARDGQIGL